MKSILVSIADGFHFRYLIQTGIVEKLLNKYDVYFYARESLVEEIARIYPDLGERIYVYNEVEGSKLKKAYLTVKRLSTKRLTETLNIKNENKGAAYERLIAAIAKTIPSQILSWVGVRIYLDNKIISMLEEKSIDFLVASTPGQKMQELSLIASASYAGVPIVAPVYSWDNLTAKGPFSIDVDYLIVWNEQLKREAIYYHNISENKVLVSGVPVFDGYRDIPSKSFENRAEFSKQLGFTDESLPLVTVTTIPRIYYGDGHIELVNLILSAQRENRLPEFNILVRPHPMDNSDYSSLISNRVVVDNYGSSPDPTLMKWVPRSDNVMHLGRTMQFSDVVINVASTITIDAAWFDTPVINVGIDFDSAGYSGSIRRYYCYTHYKLVVDTGAADLVLTCDRLIEALSAYIDDPGKDATERTKLIALQAISRKHDASSKTADLLVGLIDGV